MDKLDLLLNAGKKRQKVGKALDKICARNDKGAL